MDKAVMAPLIISHEGAVNKDTVRRWKDFAPDITVDWVRMAQNVLRYNLGKASKYFNDGSLVSEAKRRDNPEELEEEAERAPERNATVEARNESLRLDHIPEDSICVRPPGTPPPHEAPLTPARRGNLPV